MCHDQQPSQSLRNVQIIVTVATQSHGKFARSFVMIYKSGGGKGKSPPQAHFQGWWGFKYSLRQTGRSPSERGVTKSILNALHWCPSNFVFRSSVRIGDYDTRTDPDCGNTGFCAPAAINHAVSQIIVHPDYVDGQYHHDIALLILRTAINYTGNNLESNR